jgi:hypothetical protein
MTLARMAEAAVQQDYGRIRSVSSVPDPSSLVLDANLIIGHWQGLGASTSNFRRVSGVNTTYRYV